jgi:O-antigen/teichoic acid export membrane protein
MAIRLWPDRGLTHSALGQASVALCSLVGLRLYTELLTREQFGRAMLTMGLLAVVDGLLIMSFNQTLLLLCAGCRDDHERQRIVIALAARLLVACAAASLLVALALSVLFEIGWLSGVWVWSAGLFAVYACEEVVKTAMTSPLLLQRRFSEHAAWVAAEAVLCTAGVVLALILAGRDPFAFLAGFVVARVATTTLFSLRHFPLATVRELDWRVGRTHVRPALFYGLPISAMSPLGWLSTYLDRYALSAFSGIADAGGYAAVAGLVARPYGITTATLTNYFRPLLAAERHRRDKRAEAQWLRMAAALGLAGSIAFMALGPQIVSVLLAPEYRLGAAPLLGVIAVAQTFTILTHAADNSVLASGESARLLKLQAAFAFAPLAFVPLGAATHGALGAACGRLTSEVVKFAATYHLSRNLRQASPEAQGARP